MNRRTAMAGRRQWWRSYLSPRPHTQRDRLAIVVVGLITVSGYAVQEDAPGAASSRTDINAALRSGDAAAVEVAVRELKTRLSTDPNGVVAELQRSALKALVDAGFHDAASELAKEAILAAPGSTPVVEVLLTQRTRALLAKGRSEEALADAKSLFNVASMAGTSNAILLLGDAVSAARQAQDPDAGRRYRAEQLLGSTTQPAEGQKPPTSATVLGIKVDASQYDAAIRATAGATTYDQLVARGNLLLMADRVPEAREVFEAAYQLVDDRRLPSAAENLARCIKAEDGTIGRANVFVLSLRAPSK